MATITTDLICNLNQPVAATFLHGNLFSQDNAGNTINVHVMDNGEPATIGGTVSANVIRADGNTVAVSGAIEGNKASVVLPQACYAVPGRIEIIIKLTQSTTITTIAAIVANVYRSTTDTVIDPGTIIPSVQALIAEIEEAVDSIPVDYSGLLATIAADYSSSKTYPVVGMYAWQGGVLKRNIVPITTAETYTAAHWTDAVLGDDLTNLKSAFDYGRESIESEFDAVTGNRALVFVPGRYIAASTPAAGVQVSYATNSSTVCVCAKCACEPGDVFTVHVNGYTGTNRAYFFCDSDMKIVSGGIATANTEYNGSVTAPAGSAFAVFTNVISRLGEGYYAYKGTAIKMLIADALLLTNKQSTSIPSNSDLNDYTAPGTYTVMNSTTAGSISHIPVGNGGKLIVSAISSLSFLLQVYISQSNSYSNIHIRKRNSEGSWGSWVVLRGPLSSTSDTTDRSTAINAALTTTGRVELEAKDYYVSGINMPDDTEIVGSGEKTRIILLNSVTTGAAIKMGSRCAIRNCSIVGNLSELSFDTSGDIESIHIGTRHGILWLGDATESNSSANAHFNGIIENCWISDFTGGGITCEMTGYGTNGGINVSNCHIRRCGAGINVSYWSEFNRFTTVNCNGCYYGVINNGGNNVFSNCGLSANHVGFYSNGDTGKAVKYDGTTATVKNGGHGTLTGSVINHSGLGDDSNNGYAIWYKAIDSGFVFTGLQIFYGKLWFRGAGYLNIGDVNFGNTIDITLITSTILYIFHNCFFRDNVVAHAYDTNMNPVTTFDADGNTNVIKFIDCYKLRGGKVTLQNIIDNT